MSLFFNQFKILLWRNFLLKKLNLSRTIQEIILPFYFIGILVIIKSSFKETSYDSVLTGNVQKVPSFQTMVSNPVIGFVLPTNDESIVPLVMNNTLLTGIHGNIASKVYKSEVDFENSFYENNENERLVAGVIFDKNMQYSIRLNGTDVTDSKEDAIQDIGYARSLLQSDASKYLNGFLQLQLSVDEAIIRSYTNEQISLTPYVEKLGSPKIKYDTAEKSFNDIVSMYVTFIFVSHLCIIVSYLVTEKENKTKQGMIMAGLNRSAFWLSWVTVYFIFIAICSIFIAIVLKVGNICSQSNIVLIFLLITFYGLSNCILGFVISTFFNKMKIALVASSFMTVIICVMYIPISFGGGDKHSTLNTVLGYFLSPISLGLSMDSVLTEEVEGTGIGFSNFFSSKFGENFFGLIVCNILYFVLAIFFDTVIENKNRTIFNCFKVRKQQQIDVNDNINMENQMDIQLDERGDNECSVEIANISRLFKKPKDDVITEANNENGNTTNAKKSNQFAALDNISMKVYQNEIFAILGHNGAGKSTLLNIMVGILKASSGNVYYNGKDIRSNTEQLRKDFGVCSQTNTLFDELTVEQHIIVYSGLKGIENPDIDGICESIDLKNHKNSVVSALSGGQKRKLCIGLAFIGDPKYVFLDEPTTGLDPYSRHKMWELFLSKKEGRVIFLTTHYMDEADIVADRKVIISKGKIRCLGTSLYLKNHFKMGYHLDVETADEKEVQQVINKNIKNAIFLSKRENVESGDGTQCFTWKLPLNSSQKFEDLFNDLEILNMNKKVIKGYALSIPTLEELFIQLEDENSNGSSSNGENSNKKDETSNEANNNDDDTNKLVLFVDSTNLPKVPKVEKGTSTLYRMLYLIYIRIYIFLSNKTFAVCGIFLPVGFTILSFIIAKAQSNDQNSNYQDKELMAKSLYKECIWNYDTKTSDAFFNAQFKDSFIDTLPLKNSSINFDFDIKELDKIEMKEPYIVSSISGTIEGNSNYRLNVHYNDSMPHSIPATFNLISNAILASKNVDEEIVIKSHPMDYVDTLLQLASQITIGLYIGAALASGIAIYGPLVVYERVFGLVQQLSLNGLSRKNYWFSVLVSDNIIYYITCALVVIIGVISGEEAFRGLSLLIIIIVILFWALACMIYQYLVGFLFKKSESATSYMPMINIFPAMVCSVIVTLIQNLGSQNMGIIFSCIFTLIIPVYGILGIITQIYIMESIKLIIPNISYSFSEYMKIKNGILPIILVILADIVIYSILLITIDKKINQTSKGDISEWNEEARQKCDEKLANGDEDVYNEWKKLKNSRNETSIRTFEVSKEYVVPKPKNEKQIEQNTAFGSVQKSVYRPKKFVRSAVEDISFGVNSGECFGLLGPNGAGKSTTLNMITSTLSQTTGEITYSGIDTYKANLSSLSLGYCPQTDCLWNELSLLRHIKLLLVMRGYTKEEAEKYARQYIECCNLIKDQNKNSEKLSGGTKRKVCLLMAICGSPKHIFLDEPTAGMDPSTRRYVWNIITEIYHSLESAILMTTHSMEEAEFLCSRIAIIVNGRLVCIGSPEHLKMKYGEKYILEVQSNDIKGFHRKVIEEQKLFNNIEYEMHDSSNTRRKYEVNIKEGLGQIFKVMEKAKSENIIEDYSFGQASLEQVFINFAKKQTEVTDN